MDTLNGGKPDSSFGAWANLLLNHVSALEKDIKDTQNLLRETSSDIYKEIDKNKNDVNVIKIALESINRISDKIEYLKECVSKSEKMNETMGDMREDIAGLKVRASLWGGLSGVIGAIGTVLIYLLTLKK